MTTRTADGARGADVLSGIVSRQLQSLSRAWSGALSADVTFDPPRLEPVAGGRLDAVALPWPMAATGLSVRGDLEGEITLLMEVPDAVAACAPLLGRLPSETAGGMAVDAATAEALRDLFGLWCGCTTEAFQQGAGRRVRVRHEFTREALGAAALEAPGAEGDARLARVKLRLGERPTQLWEILSPGLAGAPAPGHEPEAAESAFGGGTTVLRRRGGRGKVLVVDDVAAIRNIIRWVLEKDGFSVVEAADGATALAQVSVERPDVILLDLMMPGLDGISACRRLRALPEGGDAAVIMCTSNNTQQDVIQAVQAGANDYIVKPFTHATLVEKVRRAREKQGR